jgi:hypothetical protein
VKSTSSYSWSEVFKHRERASHVSLMPVCELSIEQFVLLLLHDLLQTRPTSPNCLGIVGDATLVLKSLSDILLEVLSILHSYYKLVIGIKLCRNFFRNCSALARDFQLFADRGVGGDTSTFDSGSLFSSQG